MSVTRLCSITHTPGSHGLGGRIVFPMARTDLSDHATGLIATAVLTSGDQHIRIVSDDVILNAERSNTATNLGRRRLIRLNGLAILRRSRERSRDHTQPHRCRARHGFTSCDRVKWLRISADCPYDCPCDAPKLRLHSQRQPTRSIGEVNQEEGFTRKTDGGREADFRLANRRLQPLGHLTAARKLSINEIAIYGLANVASIVPEIVPATSQKRRGAATLNTCGAPIQRQRFFSPTTILVTAWVAPGCSHEPASTFVVGAGSRDLKRAQT